MVRIYEAMRTSEFWVAFSSACLAFLVNYGVVDKTAADFVNMGIVYVVGRLFSKAAKATFPSLSGGPK